MAEGGREEKREEGKEGGRERVYGGRGAMARFQKLYRLIINVDS